MYEAIFQSMPFPLALVDSALVVRDASAACVALLHSDRERVVGRGLLSLLVSLAESAEDVERFHRAIAERLPAECSAAIPDGGGMRRLSLHATPVGDAAGEPLALVHFAVASAALEYENLDELLGLIRGIKHEINNPLTGALGNINLLLRRPDLDEKMRKRLTVAEQEMKKIGQIVVRLAELTPKQ